MLPDYRFEIHSDGIAGLEPLEAHDILKTQQITANHPTQVQDAVRSAVIDVPSWLPYAAESYQISSGLADYLIIPCTIMYSDLPNRNGVGFPFDQLSSWNPDTGLISYQTWKGKPTHIEHINRNKELAKGVIFSASMYPMKRFQGNLYAVSLLLGFDRAKDKGLTDQILSGARPAYSMGAICQDYCCNICNARYSRGGCEHFKLGSPRVNIVNGRLAYLQAQNFIGIECSSVDIPAYFQARNTNQPMMFQGI